MAYLLNGAEYFDTGCPKSSAGVGADTVFFHAQAGKSEGAQVLTFADCVILPGFADVHVHFREPGFSYKETMATGTAAAARGGYGVVCTMPNLNPCPDSLEHLQPQLDAIARDACIRVLPYGAISCGEKGEALADLEALAEHVCAFSDDGKGVQSDSVMRQAMLEAKRLGKLIVAHCEDESLLHGGYIHDGPYARAYGHRGISSESEWRQVERDLRLVRETGCAYHVCHVSTKESVALIRQAKSEGLDVTCETAPHYLVLTDADLQEDGRYKMNPPLRQPADRDALLEGLMDGTVDMIATDHAPHSAEEKGRGLEQSNMGVVGLETAFPILYTHLVRPGIFTLGEMMEFLCHRPRARFCLGDALEQGDVTVFDLNMHYRVDPREFLSLGKATPFAGMNVFGRCRATFAGGRLVWKEDDHAAVTI